MSVGTELHEQFLGLGRFQGPTVKIERQFFIERKMTVIDLNRRRENYKNQLAPQAIADVMDLSQQLLDFFPRLYVVRGLH